MTMTNEEIQNLAGEEVFGSQETKEEKKERWRKELRQKIWKKTIMKNLEEFLKEGE